MILNGLLWKINSSVLFFYIPYMCVRIWYLSFSFWLTSLCIIGSRFLHLITTDSNVFLFNGWVIFLCIYCQSFFIYSPVDGHLGWFHVLVFHCKYCCNEHLGTCVFFNYGFLRVELGQRRYKVRSLKLSKNHAVLTELEVPVWTWDISELINTKKLTKLEYLICNSQWSVVSR